MALYNSLRVLLPLFELPRVLQRGLLCWHKRPLDTEVVLLLGEFEYDNFAQTQSLGDQ